MPGPSGGRSRRVSLVIQPPTHSAPPSSAWRGFTNRRTNEPMYRTRI
jgi:hypothetical protein